MKQNIRPSQFILTYGPGSILEGEEPCVIPDADKGLFDKNIDQMNYRIDDDRMSIGLLHGAKIYRLPTNDEFDDEQFRYRMYRFPRWRLCLEHENRRFVLYNGFNCPMCHKKGSPIRFVMACRNGHLDDISWSRILHGKNKCPNSENSDWNIPLWWVRRGSTLSEIDIECSLCSTTRNLGQLYYSDFACSGRHIQREYNAKRQTSTCKSRSWIIPRQSSNLRIAETKTLLSISNTYTKLHQHVQEYNIKHALNTIKNIGQPINQENFINAVKGLVNDKTIPESMLDDFEIAGWEEINDALNDMAEIKEKSYEELMRDEFDELIKASYHGAPSVDKKRKLKSQPLFEVNKNDIRIKKTNNNNQFTITPIQLLRTVTIQTGFRRDIHSTEDNQNEPELVDIGFVDKNTKWYPGVEFFGEGLFIRFTDTERWENRFKKIDVKRWLRNKEQYSDFIFNAREPNNILHPKFIWWHTLSHALIRIIGELAGYSAASIKERIYYNINENSKHDSGLLLYATQPGNESTYGGLIALGPFMDDYINHALEKY